MDLFRKKPIEKLLLEADNSERGLRRTMGVWNLIALGIGAIVGAGLFVRTAAAAGEAAGPAVILSFIIAATGCAFAGLCYAEFAALIPVAGSAYTYAYVTMGEFVAWIIGWALILEYALSATTVAIAWSEYVTILLGRTIPYQWCHSYFETGLDGTQGIINVPAIFILIVLTIVVIRGGKASNWINAIIVTVKITIVVLFIVFGWQFIQEKNYTPFIIPEGIHGHELFNRHGWGGVFGGAAIVFFAFIGFDAVSTAAQEAKNPKRDMPVGILGSLVGCTILYILFAHVLTGVANWQEYKTVGREASVVYAIEHYMPGFGWLSLLITIALLAGFSSVILVMLMGQSRIFYSMAKDGLLPNVFSEIHSTFRTPYKANLILLVFVSLFAGFMPGSLSGDLTSIGTLFAFIVVCAGVWVLRIREPNRHRPFVTPWVPAVPILGILICTVLVITLSRETQITALIWMVLGLIIYFVQGNRKEKQRKSVLTS